MRSLLSLTTLAIFLLAACQQVGQDASQSGSGLSIQSDTRIVSLSGAMTEILCLAGLEANIVGVDVTSTYPASMQAVPKVGHNRNIQAEGILSLNPTLVIGKEGGLKPEVEMQLRQTGVPLLLLTHTETIEGAQHLISQLADTLGKPELAGRLNASIDESLNRVQPLTPAPRALFIYARGAGNLMVAGTGTQMELMLKLAGAEPVIKNFDGFKPYSPEALLAADPEAIVLFESGLNSLEGEEGLLEVPGVAETSAGRSGRFIAMDGQFVAGFGPRVGEAALALNQHLQQMMLAHGQ
ncbi:MAG: helical backbone metal receptor [Bacteroidota bacterium]